MGMVETAAMAGSIHSVSVVRIELSSRRCDVFVVRRLVVATGFQGVASLNCCTSEVP